MTMAEALIRPIASVLYELRACWATGRRVALRLDADVDRLEGHVTHVAATGAFCVVSGWHVPAERVLSVLAPSRLGDSTYDERGSWHGRTPEALAAPLGQLPLWAE